MYREYYVDTRILIVFEVFVLRHRIICKNENRFSVVMMEMEITFEHFELEVLVAYYVFEKVGKATISSFHPTSHEQIHFERFHSKY